MPAKNNTLPSSAQSLGAERAVLGAILIDNAVVDGVRKIGLVPAAFKDKRNREIFQVALAMRSAREEIDLLTLRDNLRGVLDDDGYLDKVTEDTPTAEGATRYAKVILRHWKRREEIAAARDRVIGLEDGTIPVAVDEDSFPQFNLTDSGNAEFFREEHDAHARFCPQVDRWFVYDGTRFKIDDDLRIYELADATVRKQYEVAAKVPGRKGREELVEHALASESKARQEAMIFLARHRCRTRLSEFDTDPMLLSCQNGIVDLRTGDLRAHSPGDFITKVSGTAYDEKAQCRVWHAHLDLIFRGDQVLVDWFQRVVGYLLTGDISEQAFFLLYGDGTNGKSVTVQTIARMLGEYSISTRGETLLRKKHGAGANNDIAALVGSRCVTIGEGLRGRSLDEDLVKTLTGGDTITARFLHREFFNFRPTFKIMWSTNHLPRIVDTTESIWRRIRLIPFKVRISPEIRDPKIEEKLKSEFPGILAWAVEGCLRWQDKGIEPPDIITEAVAGYREEENPIGSFLEERTLTGPGMTTGATILYRAYRDYQEEIGEHHIKQAAFGRLLAEKGFERDRGRGGIVQYFGIGLLDLSEREGLRAL